MIDKNDHRLTAFALGELAEADFPETEAEISSSLELQAEVEAIRKIAEEVSEILQAEKSLDNIVCTPRKIKTSFIKRLGLGYYVAGISSAIVVAFLLAAIVLNNNNFINNTISNSGDKGIEKIIEKPDNNNSSVNIKTAPDVENDKSQSNTNDSESISDLTSKEEEKQITAHEITKSEASAIELADKRTIDTLTETVEATTDNANNTAELAQNNTNISNFLLDDHHLTKRSPRTKLNSPYDGQHDIRNPNIPFSNTNAAIFDNNNVNNRASNMQNFVTTNKSFNQNLAQNQFQKLDEIQTLPPNETNTNSLKATMARSHALGVGTAATGAKLKLSSSETLDSTKKNSSDAQLSAYEVMRRSINDGKLPSASEVKIGDYVNNFRYNYSLSENSAQAVLNFTKPNTAAQQREAVVQGQSLPPIPAAVSLRFVVQTDLIQCPWNANRLLARVGVKKLSDKKLSGENSAENDNANLTANPKPDDEHLKIVVKFSKNKIREYLPMNKTETEALSRSDREKLELNEKDSGNVAMSELCDVGAAISSRSEVTLLYEVIPTDRVKIDSLSADDYFSVELVSNELISDENKSDKIDKTLASSRLRTSAANASGNIASEDVTGETQFAAAVVLYGLLLQNGGVMENCDWNTVKSLATPNAKNNEQRKEFLQLVEKASALTHNN
ncbi:MAG: von Willebrand factor type A domain-containing protein [Planctomycetaceae bacterium]|jgi:hypothetical protein|nr:von Willebrand factor type A domain-containing protein [Planctomycetaceae bacterium]